jgi:hypothetical protein
MIVVFILQHFEWRFELWRLKGERITIYRKPMLKSWGLMDSFAMRKRVEIEDRGKGTGRRELSCGRGDSKGTGKGDRKLNKICGGSNGFMIKL